MGGTYRVQEFAELAGVTVRALHHYDRLDLLKPRRRTSAGYRLYEDRDLERLEQIVALKFLGLDLKQIKTLLHRDAPDLADALRRQRSVLEEKRRLLDSAIAAIREAELAAAPGKRLASGLLRKIIAAIEKQGAADWMMQYYKDEATRVKLKARQRLWSPTLQARTEKQWADLIRDVEAALGEDPAGDAAQALAKRWKRLVEGFTGGDPQIAASVKALYADRANWPAAFQGKVTPFRQELCDFIAKAAAARKC
jgi:DNA-binding transcriptional MerR regulator